MSQDTLFGKKVISSINFDEEEIIKDILYLHSHEHHVIDVDPCYSIGVFYKNGVIRQPKYKFDKTPQLNIVVQATSDNLPIDSNSIKTIMFDPPFVLGGMDDNNVKDGSNIIMRRFSYFQNFNELKEMYSKSLMEFYRILADKGIVIFKCQDVVSSGKNHFSHCWVMNEALRIWFYPKDLFILLAKNRIIDGRKQRNARKFHCYYWVFEKTKNHVDYSSFC